MKPFKTKFQRVETKFIISEKQFEQLNQVFDHYMEPNEYADSTIANLYYDTPTFQMIRASIEKPDYKEKIRVRSYNPTPTGQTAVFTEVKKKVNKVVYKRRLSSELDKTMDFLQGDDTALPASQVKEELIYMMQQYDSLEPKMYIYYDRFALQGKEDESVRITFDSNLLYRNYDLDLTKGVYGEALLPQGYRLMEVKIAGAYPIWLSRLLSEVGVYKSSFSKYGAAYKIVKTKEGLEHAQFAV